MASKLIHPPDKVDAIRNPDGWWINTECFREEARHFQKYGRYCDAPVGTASYNEYWDEQLRRRIEGYEVGGARITGPHYEYLNFSPIKRTEEGVSVAKGAAKVRDFPDFWDYDYNYYHCLKIARQGISVEDLAKLQLMVTPKSLSGNHHFIVGKTRRRGYSYKGATIAHNTYDTVRASLTLLAAFEKKYMIPKGILAMFNNLISFIDANTAFAKRREFSNTAMHKKASYKEMINGTAVEKGFMSEVMGLTFKDNPDASRGGDAAVVLMDEAGEWPGLEQAFKVLQPLCEDGIYITGQIIVFGCVCAGTKVWTHDGREVNIEDLSKSDGIIGYAGEGVIKEPIVWMKPPAKKRCVRITTNGGQVIECSHDHPLLWSRNRLVDSGGKKLTTFMMAEDIRPGDQLMRVRQIPIFGNKTMLNPRLVGMLIGDGYYGKGTVTLSIEGDDTFNWLTENYAGAVNVYKEWKTKEGTNFREVALIGMDLQLRELELYGQTWENKQLPSNLHECDQWTISELIGGYFDADGCVVYNEKKNVVRAVLTSKYKHLLEQVQTLLMKLNVSSSIVKEYRKGGFKEGDIYRLYISKRKDIIEFRKHIKLTDSRKSCVLDLIDENKATRSTYNSCSFELNEDNGKGTFYIDNDKRLENLEAFFVKSVEDIGEKEVYNLNAGITHTYITNGFVSGNTGGDMAGGSVDFAKMFYDPEAYNMLAFENIWDDDGEGDYCGFYTPDYMNKVGYIDEAGNSITKKAREFEEARRSQMLAAGKKEAYNQHIQEFSFMPSESFLITGDNMFPIKLLRRAKAHLESTGRWKGIPVYLSLNKDGNVQYRPDLEGKLTPLYRYAGTPKDLTGAVVMYSPPKVGVTYKWTYDTIQHEQGGSLASIQVYIDMPASPLHNKLVCSFYGRGTGPDDCDFTALKMARLYNDATGLHENMYRSTKNNFIKWGFEHLLDAQPDLFIKNVIKDSRVEREYGVHMTDKIKLEACLAATRMLETVVAPGEEDGEPLLYLDTIEDIRLLEELIRFNFTGNFDAAISFLLRAIQDEEDTLGKISKNQNTKGIGTELEELRNARIAKRYR